METHIHKTLQLHLFEYFSPWPMLLLLHNHFFHQGIQSLLLTQLLPLYWLQWVMKHKCIKSDLVSFKESLSWSPGSAHKLSLHTDKLGTLLNILHDICHFWYLTVRIGWTSQAENLIYLSTSQFTSNLQKSTIEKGTHLCIESTAVYCHCAGRPFREYHSSSAALGQQCP